MRNKREQHAAHARREAIGPARVARRRGHDKVKERVVVPRDNRNILRHPQAALREGAQHGQIVQAVADKKRSGRVCSFEKPPQRTRDVGGIVLVVDHRRLNFCGAEASQAVAKPGFTFEIASPLGAHGEQCEMAVPGG